MYNIKNIHVVIVYTLYISKALAPYFGGIISFVKEVDPLLESGLTDDIKVDKGIYLMNDVRMYCSGHTKLF